MIKPGTHSNLGPVDPQFGGIPAQGVVEEFRRAIEEIKKDPSSLPIWQTIIAKYHPTFIGQCERAIEWSLEVVAEWLKTGMFKDDKNAEQKADKISSWLANYEITKNHARHISMSQCIEEDE
jgi:hypothetical protein